MTLVPIRTPDAAGIDPRLEATLRYLIAIGAVLVVLLPAARGMHAAIGWLPLWLLAMPMTAWWALHGFPLPRAARRERAVGAIRSRRIGPQARRRARQPRREALPRAA